MVRQLVELKARLTWNGIRNDVQRRIGFPVAMVLLSWVAVPSLLGFFPWITRVSGRLYAGLYMDKVLDNREEGDLAGLLVSGKKPLLFLRKCIKNA